MVPVLHGIADGNYSAASPPDEDIEQPDAGVVAQPRVHSKKVKWKSAYSLLAQEDKEPPPRKDEITEENEATVPVEAARKQPKQHKEPETMTRLCLFFLEK